MSRSVSYFARLYQQRMVSVVRNSIIELCTRVQIKSPIHSGSFRSSWTGSIGSTPYVVNVNIKQGDSHRNDWLSVAQTVNPGNVFWFANGQPYGPLLEYEGHSPQAPSGMVRITIAEFPQIVRSAVNASRS